MNSISLKKADLLISDYIQATDPREKDIFLSVAGTYIREIEDPEIELVYYRVCEAPDPDEKELYLEILGDLLLDRMSALAEEGAHTENTSRGELLAYITTLSPIQIDKLVSRLAELVSICEEA